MITGLFFAHSGLRYLILLVGIVAVVYFGLAWRSVRAPRPADRVLMAVFVGLLDLQIVLGIGLVLGGIFYPALVGHMALMVGAAIVAHLASVTSRRASNGRSPHALRLAAVLAALTLIVGGIQSIGRGILQTNAPSLEVVSGE